MKEMQIEGNQVGIIFEPKKKKLTLQAENYEKVEYDMKDILGIITDKK